MKYLFRNKQSNDNSFCPSLNIKSPIIQQRKGLEIIYLMNIVPYLENISTLLTFIFVSRKCFYSVKRLKINPFYSCKLTNTKERIKSLKKEIQYFIGIETFLCDSEMIEKLTIEQINKIKRFNLYGKVIYTAPNLIQIASKITYFSFYVDLDVQIPIQKMVNLKKLLIDMNGNTEMVFFTEYIVQIFTQLQSFQFFHSLVIECNGIELKKIFSILNKFKWNKIKIIIKCFDLREEHITWLNELKINNYIISCYSNELKTSFVKLLVLPLYDASNTLTISNDILQYNKLLSILNLYWLVRLHCFEISSLQCPVCNIDLSIANSLQEFNLTNSHYLQPSCFILPTSLQTITFTNCSNITLPNLASIHLSSFSIKNCSTVQSLFLPSTLTFLEIRNTPINPFLNLELIQLKQISIIQCSSLESIIVPSSIQTICIYWCDSLTTIEKVFQTTITKLDLFHCMKLKPLALPITISQLYISFCQNDLINNIIQLTNLTSPLY
ncbi:hypothetical protein EDI_281610 [Entamoeba dispar SAW760]|uniref:Leucine-rich repeat containing protein n=1 Tax=Entamoeba dispar (strain ATCC PRA-260 / SAW760) TaxID=370354 RepID=B0EP55_ENTDS|nr:uncharacterized protein EDI_281610 [Entamoeba dispar SAW760]EDR23685.1 hypothetical protein EDI_281610 [Entamoeba dispar SAW760]|eukprot:EDR23685.1 hypothetical protein EDI_281610 [Entamoeba dispar SAW760]